MKINPTRLFLLLTLVAVGLGLLTYPTTIDINIHDTYFVIAYFHIAMLITVLSALTSLCYFTMTKLGRPISNRTGYWHFGLIVLGLLVTFILFKFHHTLDDNDYIGDILDFCYLYAYVVPTVIALLLFLSGLTVFVIGLFRAIIKRTP